MAASPCLLDLTGPIPVVIISHLSDSNIIKSLYDAGTMDTIHISRSGKNHRSHVMLLLLPCNEGGSQQKMTESREVAKVLKNVNTLYILFSSYLQCVAWSSSGVVRLLEC